MFQNAQYCLLKSNARAATAQGTPTSFAHCVRHWNAKNGVESSAAPHSETPFRCYAALFSARIADDLLKRR